KMFPLWMLKYLPNMAACHVAIAHDARGPNNTIVLGEASSLLAVSEAASYIQRGMADVMMAGGTGSRLNLTNMLYRGDWDLSKRNDDPSAAMRPFDKDRDGTVNGEGSAVVMLESRRHAERRGAPIMAQLLATHSTVDVGGSKKTRIEAVERSIEGVMKSGQIDPTSIAHINAHGASTVDDDTMEATAIANILGDVPVTAPKSYFGSLGAGSGLVELVASVLSLQHGRVPPTLNYKSPDPDCPINVVHQQTLESNLPVAICLNQSSTGQAVSVALQAAE
ncbi:MAG: beta-ketoacyl-[acyl-carrier-protein] synthase family protein, partial [Planctomycetales bacterium]|nr:beta-ketoacyl-[acyl-carrier-protein] synthase family protein [Planctomycetales bacterium]